METSRVFFFVTVNIVKKIRGRHMRQTYFQLRLESSGYQEKIKLKTLTFRQQDTLKVFVPSVGRLYRTFKWKENSWLSPAGSIDGGLSMKPNAHIFVSSKAEWDKGLDRITMIEKLPN